MHGQTSRIVDWRNAQVSTDFLMTYNLVLIRFNWLPSVFQPASRTSDDHVWVSVEKHDQENETTWSSKNKYITIMKTNGYKRLVGHKWTHEKIQQRSTTCIKLHQTDTSPLMEQQQKYSNWHLPADGTAAEMQSFTVASVFRCARSSSVHSYISRDSRKEQHVAVQHLPDLWVLQLLVNWPTWHLALITCIMEPQADHRILKSDVPISMPSWWLVLWCESDLFVNRQVEPSNFIHLDRAEFSCNWQVVQSWKTCYQKTCFYPQILPERQLSNKIRLQYAINWWKMVKAGGSPWKHAKAGYILLIFVANMVLGGNNGNFAKSPYLEMEAKWGLHSLPLHKDLIAQRSDLTSGDLLSYNKEEQITCISWWSPNEQMSNNRANRLQ